MNRTSTSAILYLLARTLLEFLLLPFHLLLFFCRRGRIRREIREILEQKR